MIQPPKIERLARAIVSQSTRINGDIVTAGDTPEKLANRAASRLEVLLVHVGEAVPGEKLRELAADLDAAVLNSLAAELDNPGGPLPPGEQAERWTTWLRHPLGDF